MNSLRDQLRSVRHRDGWRQASKAAACCGVALFEACGGGSESSDAGTKAVSLYSISSASRPLSETVQDPLNKPVPAGALRIFQIVEYYQSSNSYRDSQFFRAEEILSQFDVLRIPVNVVACDTYAGGAGGLSTIFAMVLDVRAGDFALAQELGFSKITEQFLSFGLVPNHACSYGLPSITPEQRIHGYARRVYPRWFGSEITPFGTYEQFRYRYYVGPDNYLGLDGDDVYVHNGRDWNFLYVGQVKDFIPYIDGIPGTAASAQQIGR